MVEPDLSPGLSPKPLVSPVPLLPAYMHHRESDLIVDKPCSETFLGNLTLPHSAHDHIMLSVDHLLLYTFR